MSNPRGFFRRRGVLWALLAVAVLGGAALALTGAFRASGEVEDLALAEVKRGSLVISVESTGTIQSREQVVIKNEVEGRTTILYLAPEGEHVKPGDLLVELDSSRLEEQKAGQEITVTNAEAAWVRARENLAVGKSQAESDIAAAKLDLRFAKLDKRKYEEGDYPQALQEAEGEITIAREKVQRAKEKLEWSKRLHEQRYLSRTELQADELALKEAELNLELALRKKKVLEEYTATRDMEALESAIVQAERALERVQRKANADLVQMEAELRAKKSELERQRAQLAKLEDQIRKCTIRAPVGGMVVYATTGGGRWRDDEPLEEGSEIREREELVHLPTADSMKAEVKVHESALEKVRVGLPVRIGVDATPGRTYEGELVRIAVLPDQQSRWLNPDLKVYSADVHITSDASELRPGMSCTAEIFVERFDDTLYVPVQCVVRVAGRPTVHVKTAGGVEARVVEIGLDNNRMVRVIDGLAEGEQVLLDPPLDTGATEETPDETPEIPPAKEAPAAKPETAGGEPAGAEAQGGGDADWRSMSPEERRKRFQELSPEQRRKLMERFRRSRGGGGRGERESADSG